MAAENHTVVLRCVNEATCGCSISVVIGRSSVPPLSAPAVSIVNRTAVALSLSFAHGAVVVVDAVAEDGVGNRANFTWTWTMETRLPVTVWPPLPAFINDGILVLSFNCSKPVGCSLMYSLDGADLLPMGNSSVSDAPVESSGVDTLIRLAPGRVSRSRNATFVIDVHVPAGVQGAPAVEVRLDDTTLWTSVAANALYEVEGLSDGDHVLQARAR